MSEERKGERVQVASTSSPRETSAGRVEISGLSENEMEKLDGMTRGGCWVTVDDEGRLRTSPTFNPVPGPADDEEMMPFWRHPTETELVEFDRLSEHSLPSISIQHLCGYDNTPANYRRQAEILESFGFECLRSRRGSDGRFWEIWFLASLFFAKGELKDALDGADEEDGQIGVALRFLCRRVSFGTLDVSVQRACMTAD